MWFYRIRAKTSQDSCGLTISRSEAIDGGTWKCSMFSGSDLAGAVRYVTMNYEYIMQYSSYLGTLPAEMFGGEWFLAVKHHNHKNWLPSILIHNLWLIFIFEKKIQNGRLKKRSFFKIANSQYFFVKILWIGPWVSGIEWCKGHWFGSTYMAVRLSNISSKMA